MSSLGSYRKLLREILTTLEAGGEIDNGDIEFLEAAVKVFLRGGENDDVPPWR